MFKDKIALVTGGTSGIGKEIVKQLLIEGAIVFANFGHNEKVMFEAKEELKEYKNLNFIKADISNEVEVYEMMNKIKEKHGKLDYLVNNTGANVDSFIEDFDIEEFKKVINVNLVGTAICTKYAINLLKKSNCPSIVNIGSRLGIRPCIESSAYSASKAALINFTQASALELSKYKIRVNIVNPGLTETPLSLIGWTNEEIEEQKRTNPLERLGEPVDTANAVLFLLSDKASYMTGESISITGGSILK